MNEMIKSQCMSILMSELSEEDKRESLEMLIYDEESKAIVNDFMNYLL